MAGDFLVLAGSVQPMPLYLNNIKQATDYYLNGAEIVSIGLRSLQFLDDLGVLPSLSKVDDVFGVGKKV